MSALLPVWSHMATREKEEELIFRGKQYARAIGLFQRKFANTRRRRSTCWSSNGFSGRNTKTRSPTTTSSRFTPIRPRCRRPAAVRPPSGRGSRPAQRSALPRSRPLQSGFGSTGAGAQGGMIGVTSKSKDASIKIYNGRTQYNEWAFVYIQTAQRPGQSGRSRARWPGAARPAGRSRVRLACSQDRCRPAAGIRRSRGRASVSRTGRRFGQPVNRPSPIRPFPTPGHPRRRLAVASSRRPVTIASCTARRTS